jgi:hypothetical protein
LSAADVAAADGDEEATGLEPDEDESRTAGTVVDVVPSRQLTVYPTLPAIAIPPCALNVAVPAADWLVTVRARLPAQ